MHTIGINERIIIIIINEFHRDASLKTSRPLCVTCYTSVDASEPVADSVHCRMIYK